MSSLLILASGLLIIFPFSFPEYYFAAWFAIIPFLYVVRDSSLKKGFFQGNLGVLTNGEPIIN